MYLESTHHHPHPLRLTSIRSLMLSKNNRRGSLRLLPGKSAVAHFGALLYVQIALV